MDTTDDENSLEKSEEVSFKDLIFKLNSFIKYLKTKWKIITTMTLLGGLIGLSVSIFKRPTYSAVCTFVLEDGKGGALSQYAGLASLAGIDLASSGSGVFQGDNILELYKSRLMIEKTLLSKSFFNGIQQTLIERYIFFNKLRDKWHKGDGIDSISFVGDPDKFNRKQDSLISDIVETINTKNLSVKKPDKKLIIIDVELVSKDELFAKEFVNKLVQNVNDFYVQTKTKKTYQNVMLLQKQADSVKAVLNLSISGVASAIDAAPNANPSLLSLRVPSQRKQIDVQANTAIYGEIIKNLELSKITLRQETPLIQVIDQPILPLAINRISKTTGIIGGLLIGGVFSIIMIFLQKVFKSVAVS